MDFSKYPIIPKTYSGANGKKICIKIDENLYMLKFPPIPTRNDSKLTYSNSCFSEYISCHIFNILGILAQETKLGKFKIKEKEKIVVACKDFEVENYRFQDFGSLKNSVLTSSESGYGTELSDLLYSIEEQNFIEPEKVKKHFWDMFIVDTYIGNFDRHNGNWGFLVNLETQKTKLAPIFDCGSSLFPQASEIQMKNILKDEKAIEYRTYAIPRSAIKINGVKINLYEFLQKTENIDCIKSLQEITEKIKEKQEKIEETIEKTPYITKTHKKFIKTILKNRLEKILIPALEKRK